MIKEMKVQSSILNKEKIVSVFIPDNITSPLQVLYMYDGQNLFDKSKSFYGEIWDMETQVTRLIKSGMIPPLMVVGIHSTDERLDEYSPFDNNLIYTVRSDEHRVPYYGHLLNQFIVEELMPIINLEFNTLKSYAHIAGSSLGGLMAMHAALTYPNHFRGIGAFSIAAHFNKEAFKKLLHDAHPESYQKFFISVGTNESSSTDKKLDDMYLDIAQTAYRYLYKKNKVLYKIYKGAKHNETFWASLVPTFLYFIFEK